MKRDKSEGQMLRELLRSDIGAMIESLRTDMNVQFEGLEARFERIDAQFDEVRGDIAKLDAKLERRTKTLADAIAKGLGDHERRITRLERRSQ